MLSKLKEIYQSKLINEVKEINSDYYYFYKPSSDELFGISKNITKQEYELLKMQYVEKKIYSSNENINKVYTYLLEKGNYPFVKKMKLMIYKVNTEDEEVVEDILTKIYQPCLNITLYGFRICFYNEKYETKISELFETITDDLGYNIPLHEGIIIDNKTSGLNVLNYIEAFVKNKSLNHQTYTDISEMILEMDKASSVHLIEFLAKHIYQTTFKEQNKDILDVMIKNNLNVSSSAKYLYMNRNSLINKLDAIYKETGFNLQKFKHACAIYILSKVL